MTRTQAFGWSLAAFLGGGGLLFYIIMQISPVDADGALRTGAATAAAAATLAALSGVSALLALALHRRWPALAGSRGRTADPAVALRQGALFAAALLAVLLLALFDMADAAFIVVAFLLAGLIEAFVQSRR